MVPFRILAWVIALLWYAVATGDASARPQVTAARIGLHADTTRVVLDLTDAAEFRVFTLADPYRVVIDLTGATWGQEASSTVAGGVVAGLRHGQFTPQVMRVVLDVNGPVRVRDAFLLPPAGDSRTRFVLDLEPSDPDAYGRARNTVFTTRVERASPPAAGAQPASLPAPVRLAMATAGTVPDAPDAPMLAPAGLTAVPELAWRPPLPPRRPERPMVVIDPGHGGVDPGAVGITGVHEKEIVLAVALALRDQLEATGRYRVKLTRSNDRFLRLRERVAIARAANADLFLSLHADSIADADVRGLSIYTLSEKASDREAEMLAASENRVDALGGVDLSQQNDEVAAILISLAQRDTMNHSRQFASLLLAQMERHVKLLARPHRSAGFAVLTAPDVPSVLVELGFLSNPQDARLLVQPAHQRRLARALAQGIDAYFRANRGTGRP